MKDIGRGQRARLELNSSSIDMKFVVDIAVGLWRLEVALRNEHPSDNTLEDTRSWKNLQRLLAQLNRRGITIQDKTGQPYDPGMSVRVVASEEQPGLTHDIVQETITPSVLHNETLIHAGEVVVATAPRLQNEQRGD